MDFIQTFLLALIQGVSEFLPISSSAHLILPAQLLKWPDQGLLFDVAVHVGSLSAVIFYFRHELRAMARAWLVSFASVPLLLNGRSGVGVKSWVKDPQAQLAWMLILASLPTVAVGFLAKDFIGTHLRSTAVIATTTLVFGLLLGIAEWRSRRNVQALPLSFRLAMLIGAAQVFALVPGTSRSGVTITAAVLLGMSKKEGANFSFLLSIPIIFGAGCLLSIELFEQNTIVHWPQLFTAVLVSAVSAWCCIALFLRVIERIGLMPFVWYRLVLGLALIVLMITSGA